MFFFLSKTLNYLFHPLTIVCGLLIIAFFIKRKKRKRKFFAVGLLMLLFISNQFLANEVMRIWELPATPLKEIHKKYEVGIILTGVTKTNVGPTDRVYFQRGADRVIHTVQLYKTGIVKRILVSGGSGSLKERSRQEADELADALQLMGVPKEDILIENQSRNTYESAHAVKNEFGNKYSSDQCLLITSAFHMRRSRACFQKAGWELDTFTADFLSREREFTPDSWLIPRVEAIVIWQVLTKEWMGLLAYKIAGYI